MSNDKIATELVGFPDDYFDEYADKNPFTTLATQSFNTDYLIVWIFILILLQIKLMFYNRIILAKTQIWRTSFIFSEWVCYFKIIIGFIIKVYILNWFTEKI